MYSGLTLIQSPPIFKVGDFGRFRDFGVWILINEFHQTLSLRKIPFIHSNHTRNHLREKTKLRSSSTHAFRWNPSVNRMPKQHIFKESHKELHNRTNPIKHHENDRRCFHDKRRRHKHHYARKQHKFREDDSTSQLGKSRLENFDQAETWRLHSRDHIPIQDQECHMPR